MPPTRRCTCSHAQVSTTTTTAHTRIQHTTDIGHTAAEDPHLHVCLRVPVRVVQHDGIGGGEVDAHAARASAQQKHKRIVGAVTGRRSLQLRRAALGLLKPTNGLPPLLAAQHSATVPQLERDRLNSQGTGHTHVKNTRTLKRPKGTHNQMPKDTPQLQCNACARVKLTDAWLVCRHLRTEPSRRSYGHPRYAT